jgi:hypothetical protein
MAGKKDASSRRVPEEKAASDEEIRAAIESLTEAQTERLERYAHSKINGLGRKALGRNGEDLLQHAITLTLGGDRRWNKSVSFEAHLLGAMRSTASSWAKTFDEDEAKLESELITQDCEGNERNPFQDTPSHQPNPEQLAMVNDLLDRVQPLLGDDARAVQVFDGIRGGLNGPDIQEILGISQAEFDATMKKIYRKARSDIKQGD